MKKLLAMMLMLSAMLAFTACGGDDKDEPNNQFVGKWYAHAKSGSGQWVLDIEDNNAVKYYTADDNGQITGDIRNGSYSINGNKIAFSGVEYYWSSLYKWEFDRGTLDGDYLTILYDGGADANGHGSIVFQKK